MLGMIGIALGAAAAGVLGFAATRPGSFRIERRARIEAPPERVFALLDDFRRWEGWSPWEKLDPALQRSYGGPASGVGATYGWTGNKQVGEGRMEITESTPPGRLVIKLDFLKPFEAHNTTEFLLQPADGGTTLTWSMVGESPFMMKVMSLFMSMDKMVGRDFEKGLAGIKALAEA